MPTYYKVLNEDGTPCWGGSGQWHLPTDNEPGAWMPRIEDIQMCACGYHVITSDHLMAWLGPAIWTVEVAGDGILDNDKSCWHEARLLRRLNWDDKQARLFAADCAERVLPLFENMHPDDPRPRLAIAAARNSANGNIGAAAWAAARDAAAAAARDAARDAAAAAARDAAGAAARAAAWEAAGAAAAAAARAAAWEAARAAAGEAAGAAAWAAAWEAAGEAERQWQTGRLLYYLG